MDLVTRIAVPRPQLDFLPRMFVERGTKVSQNLGHHVLARTADWLERS